MISLSNFLLDCEKSQAPADDPILLCLFHINQDHWQEAHDIAENLKSPHGSWLHALLHRIEGDDWNARYWYSRAGQEGDRKSISEEWMQIAQSYLA